jgi:hypothetical protein
LPSEPGGISNQRSRVQRPVGQERLETGIGELFSILVSASWGVEENTRLEVGVQRGAAAKPSRSVR